MFQSESLYFEYPKFDEDDTPAVTALTDINLNIEPGAFVAVLGRNGSGKSTLARHLNALLVPSSGTLWVKGMDTKDPENTWPIRQLAGMVFQNPDNQLVASIVEEDVAFGPENLGVASGEIRRRVDDALEDVRMAAFAGAAPHQLSGGQKQRIAIAGILAMGPECIILDEPTAMLDPMGRREVIETVRRLNREEGITVILITHFMEEAVSAKRVLVMDDGKVVMDAPPRHVFGQVEALKALGLDVPAPAALAHALRGQGVDMPPDILTQAEFLEAADVLKLPDAGAKSARPQTNANLLQPQPKIRIKQLGHTYDAGTDFARDALADINLDILPGEFVGVIGHTGSGKSTLIQHLNALLRPTAGQVLLDGQDIFADKKRLKAVRRQVGLVFQYPEHQLFEMTVFKDVAFGPANMGLLADEVTRRVTEALQLVGIPESAYEKSPFELSGGQRRRVAIAGVLAMQPQVLVLDEPTAGLDPAGRDAILTQVADLHRALGNTVIMVSHSMEEVARLADRIFVLAEGRIVLAGTPAQVFARPEVLEDVGLAAPPVAVLMDALRARGIPIPEGVFTVEAAARVLGCKIMSL